jgi:hypothetical protein
MGETSDSKHLLFAEKRPFSSQQQADLSDPIFVR